VTRLVAGQRGKKVFIDGDMNAGVSSHGRLHWNVQLQDWRANDC
jgi:hypothetical protein